MGVDDSAKSTSIRLPSDGVYHVEAAKSHLNAGEDNSDCIDDCIFAVAVRINEFQFVPMFLANVLNFLQNVAV